jgi:hypothetical protein
MTKNNSYGHRTPCGTGYSFSEIARKLGTGFASQTSEHDEAAARRWLFIMPLDLDVVGLAGFGLSTSRWSYGYAQSFSRHASAFNRSIYLFLARERAFKAFPVQLRLA